MKQGYHRTPISLEPVRGPEDATDIRLFRCPAGCAGGFSQQELIHHRCPHHGRRRLSRLAIRRAESFTLEGRAPCTTAT
jgi:hypothetical protein